MTEVNEAPPVTEETESEQPAVAGDGKKPRNPVRTATIVVLVVCLVLAILHLFGDRYTPRTTQARIQARVVPIAPQVSGAVTSVAVGENQFVEASEVLLTIDRTNYELAVEAAEADLQAARQSTGSLEANVDAAEAGVEAAQAGVNQAEVEATRLQRIQEADPGAVSDRRVVMAQTALEASRANLNAAIANLEKARQDLGQTGAQNVNILRAEAALSQAQVNLERTTVVSPGVGLVTGVRVDRGNFAAAGAPLMTFVGVHNLWVQADFTENNLAHVEAGDAVGIVFDVYPGKVFSGAVRSIGYGVNVDSAPLGSLPTIENDRSWLRDAQRFPVVIDFEMDEDSRDLIKVGSQASVIVYTGTRPFMNTLGRLRMRLESLTTYLY